jgi:hypothetical protein
LFKFVTFWKPSCARELLLKNKKKTKKLYEYLEQLVLCEGASVPAAAVNENVLGLPQRLYLFVLLVRQLKRD